MITSVFVIVYVHTVNSFGLDAQKTPKLTLPASLILGLLNQWVRAVTEDFIPLGPRIVDIVTKEDIPAA